MRHWQAGPWRQRLHDMLFEWHHWEEGGEDGWRIKPPIMFAMWFAVAVACWTALALVVI